MTMASTDWDETEVPIVNGKRKHFMAITDDTGDTKIVWSKDNEDEIENARRSFNDMKKKGFAAFRVNKDGKPADQMNTFDPDAEKIIFTKAMAGG